MAGLGRHDVADRLQDLAHTLQTDGAEVDDLVDPDYREITAMAGDVCMEAAGPESNAGAAEASLRICSARGWSIADLVVVRIGGPGTLEHQGGRQPDPGQGAGAWRRAHSAAMIGAFSIVPKVMQP